MQRYEDTKSVKLWPTAFYIRKLIPKQIECKVPLIGKLSSKYGLKRFERQYKLVAGFKSKITKEEIQSLNYINTNFLGLGYLLHKRVIDIMLSQCADDFEKIPVKLMSQNKRVEPFEINDFYAINVLKCVDAVDQDRSVIKWSDGWANINELYYKSDPWKDGYKAYPDNHNPSYKRYQLEKLCMIAIDALNSAIIWHPKQTPADSSITP